MPVVIKLKCRFRKHWKLRIHDLEEREPPHITIYGEGDKWRWNLRKKCFMDKKPPYNGVHKEIVDEIEDRWIELSYEWNQIHADNPVEINEIDLKEFFKSKKWDVEEELQKYNDLLKKNK
ncbi:MAG: hypothetical protein H7A23_05255 [Leptospiraceae bacterium]|nr:hypothetical protein [Leptospiraceae bacterium]